MDDLDGPRKERESIFRTTSFRQKKNYVFYIVFEWGMHFFSYGVNKNLLIIMLDGPKLRFTTVPLDGPKLRSPAVILDGQKLQSPAVILDGPKIRSTTIAWTVQNYVAQPYFWMV